MTSTVNTPQEYINQLPPDRKPAVAQLRDALNKNLDSEFAEQMGYGMISWVVPHSLYPAGYHVNPELPLPFISLANQKGYIALYHMGMYADPKLMDWFKQEYAKTGHKLDMGKSCIRFRNTDQIPFHLIGNLAKKISARQYINVYDNARSKPQG